MTSNEHPALSLRNVTKTYPGFTLGPISLEVEPGTSLAIIGPNGAGKSTLMDLIAGTADASDGVVRVLGESLCERPQEKASVGVASENHAFYRNWTGEKNLQFLSGFYNTWSSEKVAHLTTALSLPLNKKVRTLSKGNQVKLSLIAAIAPTPKLLLLDEPTAGLDPLVRMELLDTLWEMMRDSEPTIIYSTHILSDVDRIADEVLFINNGNILLRDQTERLKQSWGQVTFRYSQESLPPEIASAAIQHRQHGSLHAFISPRISQTLAELRTLQATEIDVQSLTLEQIAINILRGENGSTASSQTAQFNGGHGNA